MFLVRMWAAMLSRRCIRLPMFSTEPRYGKSSYSEFPYRYAPQRGIPMDISTVNGLTAGVVPVPQTPAIEVEQRRELIQAVRAVNQAELYGQENELSFAFDRGTQRAVVRIVDRKTREVVQQIPTEQVLRMAE